MRIISIFCVLLLNFCPLAAAAPLNNFVERDENKFITRNEVPKDESVKDISSKTTFLSNLEKRVNISVKEQFYFNGANQYYLFYATNEMIDEVFEDAKALGLNVMRIFGFCDGEGKIGFDGRYYTFQPQAGVYDEETFQKMDYIIYKAQQYGIRLVIPLVNNWDDFGGMNQYVEWSSTAAEHDDFYTDLYCKDYYRNYIYYFLNRENTYKNGLKYKDDPAVMIWELANEPECETDPSGDTLYNWIDEMAYFIKSLDKNHLVATGEEGLYGGYCGVDFIRNSQCEYIDVATFHLYPEWEHYNIDSEGESLDWITQHINDAHSVIGKPVYLGEFGIRADHNLPHTFSQDIEDFSRDPNWSNNAYTTEPVRDSSFSYDGDGSIYYTAIFDSSHTTAGGDVCYTAYADYSNYTSISGWVYISQGAPSDLKAEIYVKDYQWKWADGSDINLTPGTWKKITITNSQITNAGLDISKIVRLGIQVKRGTTNYSGKVYYDLIEGITYDGEAPMAKRNRIYNDWYNSLDTNDADGAAFWLLSAHQTDGQLYPDYDHYTVYSPEDAETCSVIQGFSEIMESKSNRVIIDRNQ